jgi:uncharacterized protein YgbK (DUF1537 family)
VTRLDILADDLTAAADCALQAMRMGARATVRFAGRDGPALDGCDVVAWDLDTRRLAGAGAAARVARAARDLPAGDTLFVNVDSTPRRHLGSVVDAALAASGRTVAVVAPAFPALGRTTMHGRQHAPGWPVRGIDVVGRLRATSSGHVVPVGPASLHNGGLARARGRQPSVILACDAATDEDLERIVAAGTRLGEPAVWVGSTGLAAPLSASVLGSRRLARPPRTRREGPVLAVVGSVARPIEAQLSQLRSVLRVTPVELDALALAHGGALAARMIDDAAAALARPLAVGADAALFVRDDNAALGVARRLAGGSEPALAWLSARIAAGLASVASEALRRAPAGGLVLTGGQTARAVCEALAIAGIDLIREVEPGVPLGRAVGAPLDVVTKAGAFGDRLSLARALATFERPAA